MRKLVCLIAVLCFTAPAVAADITFTASSSADGEITIGYSSTDPAAVPVGIGLKVTLTGSCSGTVSGGANVVSTDPCFNVDIDWAHDMPDPNDYTIGHAGQHPLADPCAAGVVPASSSEFSICMGRLDPCNPAPQSIPNLITLSIDCEGSCTLTVDIEEDGLRGGIVGAEWGSVNMVDGTVVCAEGPPPVPACWNYPAQCHGDSTGDGNCNTVDWPDFRDSLGYAYPATEYNPCADYDRDGDVDTSDWPHFRDNLGTAPPGDCVAGGTWPPS
jgi:hypothetical protein